MGYSKTAGCSGIQPRQIRSGDDSSTSMTMNGREYEDPDKPGLEERDSEPQRFQSILSHGQSPSRSISRRETGRSLRLSHSRSYGGEDGCSCFRDEEQGIQDDQDGAADTSEEKQFEVKWDSESDPLNPRCKGGIQKWCIVIIVAASSLCVTCTSSLYTLTYDQTMIDFDCSREIMTLGLSLFVIGLALGPMVLSPLSEFFGRRPIYIWSYLMFVIWMIPCAVANNIATMLVARFFDGVAGSAFLSVAGGTIGDIYAKHELSMPMMVYTASPFIGPELGPLIGGFINQYSHWRWSFYTLLIWAGVQFCLIVMFVPETYHPVLLREKARKLRKETGDDRWRAPIERLERSILKTVLWSCIRPFQLLFFEPMCLNLCILSAILLGIVYLFFGAFPLVFGNNHGFNLSQNGLAFLGILVGMLIGIFSDPLWRRNYRRLVRQNGEESEPEFRLPPTIAGAVLVPIGLFGFGWTTFPWVHWIVPIVFSGIFGLGNIWVFAGVFTFLVECYPLHAASALAANSFARSIFAAAFPLFGVQMYNRLGYQWATSLLAFLAVTMTPFPYAFFRYGRRLRGNSRFASA